MSIRDRVSKARKVLDGAVRKASNRELIIQSRGFGLQRNGQRWESSRGVCPIGALLVGRKYRNGLMEDAAQALGLPKAAVWAFIRGFDASRASSTEPLEKGMQELGRAMRRRLLGVR